MIDWFRLKLTDDTVTLIVTPPGHSDWTAVFAWADIVRVCFEPGDWLQSDTLYIFISQRSESYVIPLEANGGLDFWQALISRGLFEADRAIRVATATAGLYCWPEAEA